jgi:hypothetical protein
MSTQGFFRWRVVAAVLIILTVIHGLCAPLNLLLAQSTPRPQMYYWGAFWNAVVAFLSFAGWRLMQRQSRSYLNAGAFVVTVALLIVIRTWVGGLLYGRNPFPVFEAMVIWVPMLYAIIYAFREAKHRMAATSSPPPVT